MIRLVPDLPRLPEGSPRLWLIFFGNGVAPGWWTAAFRPGFRHVAAAAWFAEQERWVYIDPAWRGTAVELYREDEFTARLGHLMLTSAAVLRVHSRFERWGTPAAFHCVGSIKALLGVRSRALTPRQLYGHLLRHGAETVEVPVGRPIWKQPIAAATSAGERGCEAPARAGAATG